MSLASTRTAVAATLTAALASLSIKIWPSRPVPFAIGSGWLVLALADTEEITLGEAARVTYNVVIALATDDLVAETELDRIGAQLLTAMNQAGRGATLSPLTLAIDGSDIYCAVGTLITEAGTA